MSDVPHRGSEVLLRKLVDGTATPEERARAKELIESDVTIAKRHRAMVEAERVLANGPLDVPSAAELDALLPRVLDAATGTASAQPVAHASRRFALVGVPAIAALALVAFVVVRGDEFTARGGEANVIPLEVFCVEDGAPRALSVSAPSCAVGATLVIGLPTSMAGNTVTLGFVDAARTTHRAHGGDVDDDTSRVPASGLPPLTLDVTPAWARGRGDVVVHVEDRGEAKRPVEIVP